VAFICVPTPSIEEGKLDISIVEECVSWCQSSLIVIRSTINPGTADYFITQIESAERQKAPVLLLRLDTPGGLLAVR
jgi:membrane-bound ClpP family serine protease